MQRWRRPRAISYRSGKTAASAVANSGMSAGAVAVMSDAVSVEEMPETRLSLASARAPDAESAGWLEALSGAGREKEEAVEQLHALLLRASRFEIARRRNALGSGRASELDDLAVQSADDALMAIMRKLHTYRGESRFTTWAFKFALLEAGVKVRRRAWHGREVPLEEEGWARLPDRGSSPGEDAETTELMGAVRQAIAGSLTAHQRQVLVAITLNDVPIDVLAERLDTTRGALYKTLHDARRKLRASLAADGFELEGGSL
jgi:RNA polymerase sigma-70 factor (ECF subfamily)